MILHINARCIDMIYIYNIMLCIYINTLIWACTIELLLPFDRSKGRKLGLVPWCHIKLGWYFCQFIYMYNGSKSGIGHIYIYMVYYCQQGYGPKLGTYGFGLHSMYCMYISIHTHIYIYIHVQICVYIYTYMYR